MQVLKSVYVTVVKVLNRKTSRNGSTNGRVISHSAPNRFGPNRKRLDNGLLSFGCVNDEIYFSIFDHIDQVWPPFPFQNAS